MRFGALILLKAFSWHDKAIRVRNGAVSTLHELSVKPGNARKVMASQAAEFGGGGWIKLDCGAESHRAKSRQLISINIATDQLK